MILFLLLLTCWLIFLKSFFSQFICRWHCWCQNKRYISIFFKTFAVDAVVIEKMFWKTSRLVLKSALLTLLTWKNSTHLHFFPTYLLLTLLMPKEVYSYILTLTIYILCTYCFDLLRNVLQQQVAQAVCISVLPKLTFWQ